MEKRKTPWPPCSLFGFIVNFCDNPILLIHEVVVNFFQLPKRIKTLNSVKTYQGEQHLFITFNIADL